MTAAQFSQITLAPWRQRDRSSSWGRWVLWALIACCMAACLVFMPWDAAWRASLCIVGVVVHGAWMGLGMNVAEQNHPQTARCVPGHAASLRHATLLAWAICTLVTTLLFGLALGRHWSVTLLANSAIATGLLWATRLWWLWLLVGLNGPLLGFFGKKLAPLWATLAALWQAHEPAMLLLALLIQVWAVRKIIDDGGPAHRERYQRQALRRSLMRMVNEGRQPGVAAWGGSIEGLFRPFEAVMAAWQKRLLAGTGPRNLMARAELVLHGQQYWPKQLMGVALALALATVTFTAVWLAYDLDAATLWRHGALGVGITLESIAMNPVFALPAALWQTRREQALLRLLPGLPQGEALSRAVALGHLRHLAVAWPLTMLAMGVLARLGDAPILLYFPLGALLLALLVLTQPPALLPPQTPTRMVLPSLAGIGIGAMLYLPVGVFDLPAWPVFTGVAALSAALLAWRWPRLLAAPVALPAGRLR